MPPAIFSSRARLLRAGAACAVLLAVVGYVVAHLLTGGGGPPRCFARASAETVAVDPEQAVNAATITAVASGRALPRRAVTIALATALQESGLRNIRHGDRDSLGLFQQRPSQGWGKPEQILDPVYSAGIFYDRLVEVPGYSRLPLTVAAQRVQLSGYPQAYAKRETDAVALTEVLTGRAEGAFTCPGLPDDGRAGDPDRVRETLRREFGPRVLPSPEDPADGTAATGGGTDGRRTGRTDDDRVIVVPVRSDDGEAPRRGWELAYWAVAHSTELRIERVAYRGLEWSGDNSADGWRRTGRPADGEVRLTVAH
ncbi:hypothetical protein ACF08Y_24380 [Streptomyces pactum]|uniref:hypothetical protein n=1 Tax=Streptomyces pactum TaxID=68249 RepID=UPI0027DCAC13|nr:hypothetical protein [Streptomyces pactum]